MGRTWLLKHFPRCDRSKRMVTLDATPAYLRKGLAAERIEAFYGAQSSKIKFGVILRDPLHRAHTYFHWLIKLSRDAHCTGPTCGGCLSPDFQTYVQGVLSNGSDPCLAFSTGDYVRQLQKWLDTFSPSQFTMFLFNDLVKHGAGVAELWDKLGLEDTKEPVEIRHANKNDHRSLEEELDPWTLKSIQAHLEETMGVRQVVLELLKRDQKPTLIGYNISGNFTPYSVRQWLQNGW